MIFFQEILSYSSLYQSFQTVAVIILNLETDEIEAKASHLNQKVITLYRSSIFLIFEVVYLSIHISKSSFEIHSQSSVILI